MSYVFLTPYHCLDEEFDEPDSADDNRLCRDMAAGRWGLHPDAWGSHDPLATSPPPHRRHEPPPRYEVLPVDPAWEAQHRQRPIEPSPIKPARVRAPWREQPPEVQLTCDECVRGRFELTLEYAPGQREAAVATIRRMGHADGWTFIVGRDRCPQCSQVAPPQEVGDGAGAHQRNK